MHLSRVNGHRHHVQHLGPNLYSTGLTIGEVSARTGVGVSTLRAWERRHGFPVPQRLPSGHRRYRERDVDALRSVARQRAAGATLAAALAAARSDTERSGSSVFASVRSTLGEVQPTVLSTFAMLALSRA